MLLNRAIQGELQVSFNYFLMTFHIFQIFLPWTYITRVRKNYFSAVLLIIFGPSLAESLSANTYSIVPSLPTMCSLWLFNDWTRAPWPDTRDRSPGGHWSTRPALGEKLFILLHIRSNHITLLMFLSPVHTESVRNFVQCLAKIASALPNMLATSMLNEWKKKILW